MTIEQLEKIRYKGVEVMGKRKLEMQLICR